ncbi:MAG TPA: protocatechuate 3,4-dioxygenase subunit alpha [Candidatus Binataceae bacterium]|nr:protocatechuate 3,4-dioxygenase subunit alpha [Candidatus Binataceae bacterium]
MMSAGRTPSQTIGPFFHRAMLRDDGNDLAARGALGVQIVIEGRVLDGDGLPVGDAMVEIWQANAAGRYDHPDDRQDKPLDPNFHGFGRTATDADGYFRLRTIKPGPVRETGDFTQAPHINVSIFARGLLNRLVTRIYFPDESLNSTDPVLSAVPAPRRPTLTARRIGEESANRFRFDIILQGPAETVFFDA